MLGLNFDDGLERVTYHDRLEVRPDRTDGAHDVRTVFRARRAGVDRFPIWYSHSDLNAFPFVMGLSNCRLGRAIEFREKAAVAAADFVGFEEQLDRVGVFHAVQGHGHAFFKAHAHFFGLDLDFGLPKRHAHDGVCLLYTSRCV